MNTSNQKEVVTTIKTDATSVRHLLAPLYVLAPREREVFMEYHYWNTHMLVIAESHKISIGRAYDILGRAEKKIAATRP